MKRVSSSNLEGHKQKIRPVSGQPNVLGLCESGECIVLVHCVTNRYLVFPGISNEYRRFLLECWLDWLTDQSKIQENGFVGGYLGQYCPSWLIQQMGRTLWPTAGDHYTKFDSTGSHYELKCSIGLLIRLRREPNLGFMVDQLDFKNWRHITNYESVRRPPSIPKWAPLWSGPSPDDPVDYEIIHPSVVHGSNMAAWIPLPTNIKGWILTDQGWALRDL